jgi:hypothetical protein
VTLFITVVDAVVSCTAKLVVYWRGGGELLLTERHFYFQDGVSVIASTSTNCHVQGGDALVDIIHRKCTSVGVLFTRVVALQSQFLWSFAEVELLKNNCKGSYENSNTLHKAGMLKSLVAS